MATYTKITFRDDRAFDENGNFVISEGKLISKIGDFYTIDVDGVTIEQFMDHIISEEEVEEE